MDQQSVSHMKAPSRTARATGGQGLAEVKVFTSFWAHNQSQTIVYIYRQEETIPEQIGRAEL